MSKKHNKDSHSGDGIAIVIVLTILILLAFFGPILFHR